PEDADRKSPANIFPTDRRLDRLNNDEENTGDDRARRRDTKRDLLGSDRISTDQAHRLNVLRDGQNRAAGERSRKIKLNAAEHAEPDQERDQHAPGNRNEPQ